MSQNVFDDDKKTLTLDDFMKNGTQERDNLGDQVPIMVYRLLEYAIRQVLEERFGKEEQQRIFREGGFRAGEYFTKNFLDITLPVNEFLAQLHQELEVLKMGVLRIEELDEDTGRFMMTIAEDADCSGLPVMGEAVCNYDEGFLSGVLTTYTGKAYTVKEVDCWATGDRVCRFRAEVSEGAARSCHGR
ncbi:MAG: 4-vinyl reductase [Hungatella sp.]|jgi:predicted hydrocarbon binding protein|nr:4-vinyl reductase [Hungatella sp.]